MSLQHVHSWARSLDGSARTQMTRRALSRRGMLRTLAGVTGAVLGSGSTLPLLARAADDPAPRPIPGGIQIFGPGTELFHVFGPHAGNEPAWITDFKGLVGRSVVSGTGMATGATDATPLVFDVDMGFMQGEYIATDGQVHRGTFGFV